MRLLLFVAAVAQASAQLYDPVSTTSQQPLVATPCGLLAETFPGLVFGPGDANYTRSQAKYWSAQQAQLKPACRFYPEKNRHIQEALADIIIPNHVSIAVVSGGQSSVRGASNVEGGITFDLERFKEINFFLDAGKEVWLGVGNRWEDVYEVLQPSNLTVAGSRYGKAGVGGHVLGGGLSWFANHRGWACDDVTELELVLPSAETIFVKPHRFDDLFWSLKGSNGAFGIVTRIKFRTIENEAVYGGYVWYDQKYMPKLCSALEKMASSAADDPATQGYLSFHWMEDHKSFTYRAYLMNTDNKENTFGAFETIPSSSKTLGSKTIGESTQEISHSEPPGQSKSKFTLTTLASAQVMMELHELVRTSVAKTKFDDKSSILDVKFEPLTIPHLKAASNIFPLSPAKGPLLVVTVEYTWTATAAGASMESAAKDLRSSMEAKLKKLGALHDFIYPGDAAKDQNPFEKLSPINKRMLRATKQKFDPQNLWQQIVPGIWHI